MLCLGVSILFCLSPQFSFILSVVLVVYGQWTVVLSGEKYLLVSASIPQAGGCVVFVSCMERGLNLNPTEELIQNKAGQ